MDETLKAGDRVLFRPDRMAGTVVRRCIGLPSHEAKGRSYWVHMDDEADPERDLLCLESELSTVEG